MPDSTLVLKPGWRATDSDGNVLSGAVLKIFEGGTTTPREVFSDDDLSTSLGTEITCDSGGYPTSDGTAKTLIYTGLNAYKVELYTSTDVLIWSHDDVSGALDTSTFGGDTRITSPVSSVSTDQVLAYSDSGKLYNVNCSGGAVTITLGAATDLQDGWRVGLRHNGSANQVKVVTTGGDLIAMPSLISTTGFSITSRGQEVWLRCDGSGFSVGEVAPPLFGTTGVIQVADRLSTPPVSPTPGARYIVGTTPTGDWASFTQHDIAEADGQGNWFKYTPATDCGWMAYVQDEDIHYRFLGSAWVPLDIVADQAVMEAATSATRPVVPSVQHYHPLHPKAWAKFGAAANILASVGVDSIGDIGTGIADVNWSTAFSSAHYAVQALTLNSTGQDITVTSQAAASIRLAVLSATGATPQDPTSYFVSAYGDQ